IWGADNIVYGPVELPVLVRWVKEERVIAGTWVHVMPLDNWVRADAIPELRSFFQVNIASVSVCRGPEGEAGEGGIRPGMLRRIKVLACLGDAELGRFVDFMDVIRVRQWDNVVYEGSPGDAMFFILEGEVRVRLMIADRESILATLQAGEFFGEVALFDHGARSADVVANTDCLLLRIPSGAFQRLVEDNPDLAAPFLLAMGRSLIARLRADNRRYRDSIVFARTAH
ncbi:MAG: cyclic receptor protein, partial [Verrucomicrobiota bacterium]